MKRRTCWSDTFIPALFLKLKKLVNEAEAEACIFSESSEDILREALVKLSILAMRAPASTATTLWVPKSLEHKKYAKITIVNDQNQLFAIGFQ